MASASSKGCLTGTSTSAQDPSDREAERHLPRPHGRRQDVVHIPVEARLEDGRGVVRIGRLHHGHRDQPGHDEHLVVDAAHLLDAPAERQAEYQDEQDRRDDRREHGLRPQLRDAQRLALAQPDHARHDAMAFT
jgi:hypothetical protein